MTPPPDPAAIVPDPAPAVLAAVETLLAETGGRAVPVRRGSDLERDLGLGSLERVELLTRLEEAFGIVLPDDLVAEGHTPGDLAAAVAAVLSGGRERAAVRPGFSPERVREGPQAAAASWGPPEGARTLLDLARLRAEQNAQEVGIHLLADDLSATTLTFGDLWRRARAVAAALVAAAGGAAGRPVAPGDRVCLVLPTGLDFFPAFLGVLAAGGVPVPIYPPARLDQLAAYLERHARILTDAGTTALVTDERLLPVARRLAGLADRAGRASGVGRIRVGSVARLEAAGAGVAAGAARVEPEDLALIQYTSGSTADPKGVALAHANLLANIGAIGRAVELVPDDVVVSWLPLYHDMGLIGAWLTPFVYGLPMVVLSPLQFLSRPARWLWAFHHYRGTLSACPNFGFELCCRKVRDEDVEGLDLSSWRYAMNGSEPVWPETIERFAGRFGRYGFRREAMHVAYGLAENSVALTLPPVGRGPRYDRVERDAFQRERHAVPASPAGETPSLTFVSCGVPLDNCEVRVVEAEGAARREVPERHEGRVLFRGPSAMQGYFGNPEATAAVRHDGWIDTGDLGYVADGELYLTGRSKDLVIKGGRKYHPQDIERAAAGVAGVRKGCVVAFDVRDPSRGEAIVVVAETREPAAGHAELARRITEAVAAVVGTPADRVELVAPGTLPKTSSGKLRRRESRERLLAGTLTPPERQGTRRVVAGLAARELAGRAGRAGAAIVRRAYGIYALVLAVAVLVPAVALVVAAGRTRRSAWAILHRALRLAGRLTGLMPRVTGSLPPGPFVAVSNHASYLDALVLLAAFGRPLVFTPKRELFAWPLVGAVVRRLGGVAVDRASAGSRLGAMEAASEVLAGGGDPLHVFPESTFVAGAGLLPFHLGAFRLAAEHRLPVVPIALAGTRRVLPGEARLPRPGRIDVRVLEPLAPPAETEGFRALAVLRDRAREALGKAVGEPLLDTMAGPLETA